ncbi:MAG TPA: rRNA maturation RNase YbeY [Thermohalobaculum sp.]|nr:rRNA maturation RNase YbeY [Thermohalobaculum sp.]
MTPVLDEDLVDLAVEEPAWLAELPGLARLAGTAARLACEAAGLDPAQVSVSLLACDDARIARLNRAHRGGAGPTNVLSWPAFALAPVRPGGLPPAPPAPLPGARQPLGDVAIALQTARREAAALRIPLKDHVLHLILHGCLHLLGFDHADEEDAETMEGLETRALQRIGVPDPYSRGGAAGPHPD